MIKIPGSSLGLTAQMRQRKEMPLGGDISDGPRGGDERGDSHDGNEEFRSECETELEVTVEERGSDDRAVVERVCRS